MTEIVSCPMCEEKMLFMLSGTFFCKNCEYSGTPEEIDREYRRKEADQ